MVDEAVRGRRMNWNEMEDEEDGQPSRGGKGANRATPEEVASKAPPPGPPPRGMTYHEHCMLQRRQEEAAENEREKGREEEKAEDRKRKAEERFVEVVQEGSIRCQEELLRAELEGKGTEGTRDALRNSIRVAAAVKAALAETREIMGVNSEPESQEAVDQVEELGRPLREIRVRHQARVAAAAEGKAEIERDIDKEMAGILDETEGVGGQKMWGGGKHFGTFDNYEN